MQKIEQKTIRNLGNRNRINSYNYIDNNIITDHDNSRNLGNSNRINSIVIS